MFAIHSFLVLCAILPLSTAIRPRGNSSDASYWNRTSISTSAELPSTSSVDVILPSSRSSSAVTPTSTALGSLLNPITSAAANASSAVVTPLSTKSASTVEDYPYPIPSTATNVTSELGRPRSTGYASFNSSGTKNDTGPGCTVNIPSANIDWWFAATIDYPIATLTSFKGNGTNYLTSTANTETFDATSALATDYFFTESLDYDTFWGWTWTYYEEYSIRPTAATTSVVSRTAAVPLPTGSYAPYSDARLYDLDVYDLPPAALTITVAPNSTYVATSATPVLYFSAYEVESAVAVTADDGRVGTSASTETFSLPSMLVYPYWLRGIENYATATGTVPKEFLQDIRLACSAGSVQATVTVLIVVDLTYQYNPGGTPFLVHIESSASGFEVVTQVVTDDPQVNVFNTGGPKSTPTYNPPMIEHTAKGFATTNDVEKPPAQIAATSVEDVHNAGSNLAQGPSAPEQTRVTVGTIGTAPVVIGPSSVIVVGSQTLQPGGPAITIGGQPVSLATSATAIVVGGKTSGLPQVIVLSGTVRPVPILTIGSTTLTGNAATQFFVGPGQTLTAGGTATVGGTLVSLDTSASFVVIGGSTQVLPGPAATVVTTAPTIVIGGSTFTANPGNAGSAAPPTFTISGQTLAPGQVRTIAGTTISLAPSGSFIVINGATSFLPTAAPAVITRPEITVGGSTFTASSTAAGAAPTFVVFGQTLAPGEVITVDGTTISLAPSGTVVVINGATSTLPNPAAAQITAPSLTIGNGVFTALPGSGTTYLIGTQTLTPGGAITVADTTISLAPGATALIINGQTTFLTGAQTQAPIITNAPVLTIGSSTYTAISGTTFIIGFATLTPGGTVVVDGTTISLAPGATELVYGSSGRSTTTALFPATTTRSAIITGTSGASAGATGTDGVAAATTSQKGAGWTLKSRTSRVESWGLSVLMGVLGLSVW